MTNVNRFFRNMGGVIAGLIVGAVLLAAALFTFVTCAELGRRLAA